MSVLSIHWHNGFDFPFVFLFYGTVFEERNDYKFILMESPHTLVAQLILRYDLCPIIISLFTLNLAQKLNIKSLLQEGFAWPKVIHVLN